MEHGRLSFCREAKEDTALYRHAKSSDARCVSEDTEGF